jgi:lysyl-tRNA synthetase class 2
MSPPEPDRFELARLEKLRAIESLGLDPWGERFDGHRPIGEARELCPTEPGTIGPEIRIAGRIDVWAVIGNRCTRLDSRLRDKMPAPKSAAE